MIGERQSYHGAVLSRLIEEAGRGVVVERVRSRSSHVYQVDNSAYLFVKYSTNRLSPWIFSFSDEDCAELIELISHKLFICVVMVCGKEGVVAIDFKEVWARIIEKGGSVGRFSLQASRRPRHKFRVSGVGGEPILCAESEFPAILPIW